MERERRELEEAEVERLTWEKEKLEKENRAEQRRCVGWRVFWNPVKTLVLRYNTSISTCTVN